MTALKTDHNSVDCIRFRLESEEEMEFNSSTSMRTIDEYLLEEGEVESFVLSKEASTPLKRPESACQSLFASSSAKRLKIGRDEYRSSSNRRSHSEYRRSDRDHEPKFPSVRFFRDLNIAPVILLKLFSMNVKELNQLQRKILPTLLAEKRDNFLVQSKSHSGKKLAYLITAIHRIDTSICRTQVIILAPTSELATHIANRAQMLTRETQISVNCLTRDCKLNRIYDEHLLVVTMGTLLILLNQRELLDTKRVGLLVFDEVDIMHTGEKSSEKMASICQLLGRHCQQLFFSTGFSRTCQEFLTKQITPNVIKLSSISKSDFMDNVLQFYVDCSRGVGRGRYASLLQVLKHTVCAKALVFVTGKEQAEELCYMLKRDGNAALCLSSKTTTEERLAVFRFFKRCRHRILVTNYPLCHGMNFGEDIQMVINYDIPVQLKHLEYEYFHRISKCGRQSRPGFVVNLVDCMRSTGALKMLENLYDIQLIRLEPFD